MASKYLTTGQLATDEEVDNALTTLPPLPDNVLVALRHLQAQITALTARVEALEP